MADDERRGREWRVTQRWPDSTPDLTISMGSEEEARGRQAVLDANTSHPSGYQRRVEVILIESREVGPWRKEPDLSGKIEALQPTGPPPPGKEKR